MNIQKRCSFNFLIFCAAPVLLTIVFFVFPANKTVGAEELFISLEEAVALAGEKDEAIQESRKAYRVKQAAWLEASKKNSGMALQPEADLSPGEAMETALDRHVVALEYIKAAELLHAEELRLEYEVEECYLTAMLAQQKKTSTEERLCGREKRYAEIEKKHHFGIAGEEEIAAAQEAGRQAREELLQTIEEYNAGMAALGEKIGLALDGSWSVQTRLPYEHVTMEELGNLTELALLKEKQACAFAAEYLYSVDYTILSKEQRQNVLNRVRQALAEAVELQQPINEAAGTFAQMFDSYEKILLQYNFGVTNSEKVVSQEDALDDAYLGCLEAVFNGQAALSRLNYATNGGFKKYQGLDGQVDTTLKKTRAFFIIIMKRLVGLFVS